jgi:hypothetical protein
MFGNYFYNQHLRKSVAIFGTVFNNINTLKVDSAGNVLSTQKVPLAYGPKQKFLARLKEEPVLTAPEVALRLPRMSFEITSLTYDTSAKINKNNKIHVTSPTTSGVNTIYTSAPYNLQMQLNIIGKTQDEVLQITEQILPFFNPDYVVTVKELPEFNIVRDVPITLMSITMADDYEGEFEQRRSLIYTLDFNMKVQFYGPVAKDQGVIKDAKVNTRNFDSGKKSSSIEVIVDPIAAGSTDNYTIIENNMQYDADFGFSDS